MKWNNDSTISITPPKKPKKCTGTRFAAVLGLNKWTTPFNAWCAITRTYEAPFEDTIYTIAGKTIEPKQAEYMRDKYFWEKLVTPTDVYGEDYFKTTWGDFFPNEAVFGGMWDYLFVDRNGKPKTVLEMKTTKRAEDWLDDIPEYYAMQAALYAYLLGVDDVIMVCTVLEENDYECPQNFIVTAENTFERRFKVSERYPDFAKTVKAVEEWWEKHVVGGISPMFDEKADAEILKELRKNNLNPNSDINALIEEAEQLQEKLAAVAEQTKADEDRLKILKEQIRDASKAQFRPGDKEVVIHGKTYDWVTSRSTSMKFDEAQMKKDGVLEKYKCKPTETVKLTSKKRKE